MRKPRIVIISESYTTAIRLAPVYLEAVRRREIEACFFTTNNQWPGFDDLLAARGIRPLLGDRLLRPQDMRQLEQWQAQYQAQYNQAGQELFQGSITYKGVPVPSGFFQWMLQWNQQKLAYFKIFDRLVEEIEPDLVLVAYCSGGSKKHYVSRARQLGIKTVHMQYSFYPENKLFDRKRLTSEYVCLWGEAHRATFLDETVDPAKAVVTGNPTFDPHRYDKNQVRAKLGLSPEEQVYLVGVSRQYEELEHFLAAVGNMGAKKDAFFIVKLHPDLYDRVRQTEETLKGLSARHMVVGTQYSAYELLSAADAMVSFDADGLWLESLYFDVDSLLITPGQKTPLPFKAMEGAVMVSDDLGDLARLDQMRAAIDPAKREEARRQLFFRRDFASAPRVVDRLVELV